MAEIRDILVYYWDLLRRWEEYAQRAEELAEACHPDLIDLHQEVVETLSTPFAIQTVAWDEKANRLVNVGPQSSLDTLPQESLDPAEELRRLIEHGRAETATALRQELASVLEQDRRWFQQTQMWMDEAGEPVSILTGKKFRSYPSRDALLPESLEELSECESLFQEGQLVEAAEYYIFGRDSQKALAVLADGGRALEDVRRIERTKGLAIVAAAAGGAALAAHGAIYLGLAPKLAGAFAGPAGLVGTSRTLTGNLWNRQASVGENVADWLTDYAFAVGMIQFVGAAARGVGKSLVKEYAAESLGFASWAPMENFARQMMETQAVDVDHLVAETGTLGALLEQQATLLTLRATRYPIKVALKPLEVAAAKRVMARIIAEYEVRLKEAQEAAPPQRWAPVPGVMSVFPTVASMIDWVALRMEALKRMRGVRRQAALRELEAVSQEDVARLAEESARYLLAKQPSGALTALVHLVAVDNIFARGHLLNLIRSGNETALSETLAVAERIPLLIQGLCLIERDEQVFAYRRQRIRKGLLGIHERSLRRMAPTNVDAIEALEMLAAIGHVGAQSSLARLNVHSWIRILKIHPHPEVIHSLVILARNKNRKAKTALVEHVDVAVMEENSRRYPNYVKALTEMVEVGVVRAWVSLSNLAQEKVPTAVTEVSRLTGLMSGNLSPAGVGLLLPSPLRETLLERPPSVLLEAYRETQSIVEAWVLAKLIEANDSTVLAEARFLPIHELKKTAGGIQEATVVFECFAEAGNTAAYDYLMDLLQSGDPRVKTWVAQARSDRIAYLAYTGVVDAIHMLHGFARYGNRDALRHLVTIARGTSPHARLAQTLVRTMDLSEIAEGTRVRIDEDSGSVLLEDIRERLDLLRSAGSAGSGAAVRLLHVAWRAKNMLALSSLATLPAGEFWPLVEAELAQSSESPSLKVLQLLLLPPFENKSASFVFSSLIARGYRQAGETLLALPKEGTSVAIEIAAESFVRGAEENPQQIPWLFRLFDAVSERDQPLVKNILERYDEERLRKQVSEGDAEVLANMVGLALYGHRGAMKAVAEAIDDLVREAQKNPLLRERLLKFNRKHLETIARRGDTQADTILKGFQRLAIGVR